MRMNLTIGKTNRNFVRVDFTDAYAQSCSLQESSLVDPAAIWLGCDKDTRGGDSTRMHLTQDMVRELLPFLQHFAQHGELPSNPL